MGQIELVAQMERLELEVRLRWVGLMEFNQIEEFIGTLTQLKERQTTTRLSKKLYALHGRPDRNEHYAKGYINLSNIELTEAQEDILDLGLKCHYIRKPHPDAKRIDTEILIEKLQKLQIEK